MSRPESDSFDLDSALAQFVDYAPVPQTIDPNTDYKLMASDMRLVAATGLLRVTLVSQRLSSAERVYAFTRPVLGNDFLQAAVEDFVPDESDPEGVVVAREIVVSDDLYTQGHVARLGGEKEGGYVITLPPQGNETGPITYSVFGYSETLLAVTKARDYGLENPIDPQELITPRAEDKNAYQAGARQD